MMRSYSIHNKNGADEGMLLQPFSSGCFCVYCATLITILELSTTHACMYVIVRVSRCIILVGHQ